MIRTVKLDRTADAGNFWKTANAQFTAVKYLTVEGTAFDRSVVIQHFYHVVTYVTISK